MKKKGTHTDCLSLLKLGIMLCALLFLTVMANRPIQDIPSFALSEINEINEINKKEPNLSVDFCTIHQHLLSSLQDSQCYCRLKDDITISPQAFPVHTPPPECA